MPRIPIQSLVSSRESGVDVQPGAFQATAQATANLMSSVSGAAQMVKQQFDRAQDLRNGTQLSEKKRVLRDAQGNFLNKMNGLNADGEPIPPAQWGPLWKIELDVIKKGFEDSDMPPVVSRALAEEYENFAGSSYIQIAGAALKLNQREARQNFDRDYGYNSSIGDHDANTELINGATGLVLTPKEVEDAHKVNELTKKNDAIAIGKKDNPRKFAEDLKKGVYGAISPRDEQKHLEEAEYLGKQDVNQQLGAIQELDEAGLIEGEDDLRVQLGTIEGLSPAAEKAFVKGWKDDQPLTRAEQNLVQDRMDENLSRILDPEYGPEGYKKEWMSIQEEVFKFGPRPGTGRFHSQLNNERPDYHTQEKVDAQTEKQRQEKYKPLAAVARKLVEGRATGIADIAQQKYGDVREDAIGIDVDPTNDQALQTTVGSNELKQYGTLIRSALQKEMEKFIMDYIAEKGRNPTELEMKKFLDTDGDRIAETAMGTTGGSLSTPDAATPKKLEGANLAKDWLSPTMLPKNQ